MLFNFRLTPVENIMSWGRKPDSVLSWFGLTDGCYWLNAGDTELFRVTEQFLPISGYRHSACGSNVDYYVVRLWEDLLEILPAVLTPVPSILAQKFAATDLTLWRTSVKQWVESKDDNDDSSVDLFVYATEWLNRRRLRSSHLVAGPLIWFWNDGTHIHIEWDNRELKIDDVPVWTAQLGSWSLPVEEFLKEVRAFNADLMQAMQVRVNQIVEHWDRPTVHIDKDHLVEEQVDRSTWLQKSLDKLKQEQAVDWNIILDAIAQIEAEIEQ